MEEIKRILFNRKQIFLLVGMLMFNLFDLDLELSRQQDYLDEYQSYLEQYEGMEYSEIKADLDEITKGGSWISSGVINELYGNVEYLLNFEQRLENIQTQADTMVSVSIFADSVFSTTNIKQTAADYSRLQGIEVTLGKDASVETILQRELSNIFLVVYMISVVYQFLKERRRGLWNMVCASQNGRIHLLMWRFATVALAAIGSTLLFTGTELACVYYYCGGLDELGRMVQSIEICQTLTIPMTIGEFWILFIALRMAGIFCVGMIAWFLLEVIADYRLTGMVWALFAGIEYIFQKVLSSSNILYQVNLFTYMDMKSLIMTYVNLNLFSHAVNQLVLVLVSGLIGTVVVFLINIVIYEKRKPISGYAWVDKIIDKIRRITAPLSFHVSLLRHEQYKMLVSGKGIIVIACACLVANSISSSVGYVSHDDYQTTLESYYRKIQGKVGDETIEYIETERAKLETKTEEKQKLQEQLSAGEINFTTYQSLAREYELLDIQKQALEQVEAYVTELQKLDNGYVLPHWVYENLFADNSTGSSSAKKNGEETEPLMFISMIAMVLIIFIQLGVEKKTGMDRTQNSSLRGRNYLMLRKHVAAWTLAIILSVGIWGIYTVKVMNAYFNKLPFWHAPACCLTFLSDVPQWISIIGYWIIVVIVRTIILCMLGSTAFFITAITKKKP